MAMTVEHVVEFLQGYRPETPFTAEMVEEAQAAWAEEWVMAA